MGKLVTVVGNVGAGKTTLARVLARIPGVTAALEQHAERPFHTGFAAGQPGFALPNQVDYLLLRAEQELAIRRGSTIGVQDGGLDEDFWVFTRLFHRRGYLDGPRYELCERLYRVLRATLPPPDLVISLTAPLPVLIERHRRRNRVVEIATARDLHEIDTLLHDWLDRITDAPLLTIDTAADDPEFETSRGRIETALAELRDAGAVR